MGTGAGILPAALPGAGTAHIEHVVLIVQENRSFDDFFATFPGPTEPRPASAHMAERSSCTPQTFRSRAISAVPGMDICAAKTAENRWIRTRRPQRSVRGQGENTYLSVRRARSDSTVLGYCGAIRACRPYVSDPRRRKFAAHQTSLPETPRSIGGRFWLIFRCRDVGLRHSEEAGDDHDVGLEGPGITVHARRNSNSSTNAGPFRA